MKWWMKFFEKNSTIPSAGIELGTIGVEGEPPRLIVTCLPANVKRGKIRPTGCMNIERILSFQKKRGAERPPL